MTDRLVLRRPGRQDRRDRTVTSPAVLRSRRGRIAYWSVLTLLVLAMAVMALGPLYWMATGSFKSTQELIKTPPTLLPELWNWHNYTYAWSAMHLPRYLVNSLILAGGTLVAQLVVSVTSAFTFSVLKPPGTRLWYSMIIATLFVPATVIFIPTYVTVVDLPVLHLNLLNTPFAVWLPGAASAFNVFLLKRFFDQLPRELLDAASVDGASAWQQLRHIVLPMSRPILAVVAIFSLMASWKDFLWPKITLPDPSEQPLSVALVGFQDQVELRYVLAGLVIASIPPIILFLIFQRRIISGLSDAGINR